MNSTHRAATEVLWAFGTIVVVLLHADPGGVDHLAVAQAGRRAQGRRVPARIIRRGRQLQRTIFQDPQFTAALRNSIGIALDRHPARGAPRHVRRLRDRAPRLPRQDARARPVRWRSPCSRRSRSSARCSTCGARIGLYDTWPGLIIPYMTFTLPLAIWTLSAFFREIPWDLDKAARVDGATPFQAFRKVIAPLAAPGDVHVGDPRVHLRLERLPVRHRRSRRPTGPAPCRRPSRSSPGRRSSSFPTGQIAAASVRRHDPDHHHGAGLPAPHRRRAHLRRGEGLTPHPRSTHG